MDLDEFPKTGLAFAFIILLCGVVAAIVLFLALSFLRAMVPTEP